MGFDDEIDQLKRELQTPKLDAAGRQRATAELARKLNEKIQSRRLEFVNEPGNEPSVSIRHKQASEKLASVFVNDDGSITFQAATSENESEDEVDDAGYFPPYVEYYDEEEFLEEAPEMLKQGIAEYELDQEESSN